MKLLSKLILEVLRNRRYPYQRLLTTLANKKKIYLANKWSTLLKMFPINHEVGYQLIHILRGKL